MLWQRLHPLGLELRLDVNGEAVRTDGGARQRATVKPGYGDQGDQKRVVKKAAKKR